MSAPSNVAAVLLDSLNRHMLGSYGGTEFETPNLDRFAAERATRFTRHGKLNMAGIMKGARAVRRWWWLLVASDRSRPVKELLP